MKTGSPRQEQKSLAPSRSVGLARSVTPHNPSSIAHDKRNVAAFCCATQHERDLSETIVTLWNHEKEMRSRVKREKGKLDPLRAVAKDAKVALARHLSEMKAVLVGQGRGGAWLPFLKAHGFSRATADRMVDRYRADEKKRSIRHEGVALASPSERDLVKLVSSLCSRCQCLTTHDLVDRVMAMLASALHKQAASPLSMDVCNAEHTETTWLSDRPLHAPGSSASCLQT
jgi:hypothetical protein